MIASHILFRLSLFFSSVCSAARSTAVRGEYVRGHAANLGGHSVPGGVYAYARWPHLDDDDGELYLCFTGAVMRVSVSIVVLDCVRRLYCNAYLTDLEPADCRRKLIIPFVENSKVRCASV